MVFTRLFLFSYLLILSAVLTPFDLSKTTPVQEPAVSIINADPYNFIGPAGPNSFVIPFPVFDQSFDRAYRISVNGPSSRLSDSNLRWLTTQAVNAGDNLQISFQVRMLSPLNGTNLRAAISFEKAADATRTSFFTMIPCKGDEWTPYIFKFKPGENYAVGEVQFVLRFGQGPQAFEIGDIRAVNLGPDPPPATVGIPVITNNIFTGFGSYFDNKVGGLLRITGADGPDFNTAFEITTNGNSDFIYRSGLTFNIISAVRKDDLLLLTFYARKLEPGDESPIKAQVAFERNGGNYEKSISINFPNDSPKWQLYQIPFRSRTNFQPGEAHLIFHFGYGPQKFELAGIRLANYGQGTDVRQLPVSFYYPGRGDDNAPWRLAANERINQHRKADLTVIVTDRDGNPLPDAQVFVRQLQHAFKFGSAVTSQLIAGNGATERERTVYRSRITSHFNTTVLENDLKWPFWEDWAVWNRTATLDALEWLKSKNLSVRGHTLIWPSFGNMPANTNGLAPSALRTRIDGHFADILNPQNAGGKCYQWDVINEPFHNYELQGRIGGVEGIEASGGILGNGEMIRWFQTARNLDPNSKLFLNDFEVLSGGGFALTHQDYLFALIKWLLINGAPIDALGFQSHFSLYTAPRDLEQTIERFSQLPLSFSVTEFDVNTLDDQLQADYTRDFMTIIFSYPQFTDFLIWGFWEKSHWIPQAALYRDDWTAKPNALVFNDLVFNQWWTDEGGLSDDKGRVTVRGFKGDYLVTAAWQREIRSIQMSLDTEKTILLQLDVTAPRQSLRRTGNRVLRQP